MVVLCDHDRCCRLLLPIIAGAFVDTNIAMLLINLLVFVSVELFCIPIAFYNFVELQNETLLIAFGLIKKRIPYSDIAALSATNNPLSSLAAFFDRIEIKCKSKSDTLISVTDKERFFTAMKKHNPNIMVL